MSEHRVGEGGFDGAADHIGGRDRRSFLRRMCSGKVDREAAGRELGAGNHRREGIEDVLLRFFKRFFG